MQLTPLLYASHSCPGRVWDTGMSCTPSSCPCSCGLPFRALPDRRLCHLACRCGCPGRPPLSPVRDGRSRAGHSSTVHTTPSPPTRDAVQLACTCRADRPAWAAAERAALGSVQRGPSYCSHVRVAPTRRASRLSWQHPSCSCGVASWPQAPNEAILLQSD